MMTKYRMGYVKARTVNVRTAVPEYLRRASSASMCVPKISPRVRENVANGVTLK